MMKRFFKRWNWEYDCGEQSLPDGRPLPAEYAIAYFDHKGRLYRAVAREKCNPDQSDEDPSAFYTSVYDYFCDGDGRIIQKRSMDGDSEDGVIVDLDYDDGTNEVTESAWSPVHGLGKKHKRKQVQTDDDGRRAGDRPALLNAS